MSEEESKGNRPAEQKDAIRAVIGEGPSVHGEAGEREEHRRAADTAEGARLCAAFSDEELLDLLREAARQLGHSPSQWEIHWILRGSLKSRFKNWPGALRAAGLSRAAGRGGMSAERVSQRNEEYQRMLDEIRSMAERLGRIPHRSELPEICRKLKKRHRTWGEVLAAAGVEEALALRLKKEENVSGDVLRLLRELRSVAEGLNRAPLRSEVEPDLRDPLLRRFGSWRNVLCQIDLEPVRRIAPFVNAPLQRGEDKQRAAHRQALYDCHYRLLRLEPQTEADLALVRQLALRLGRSPGRREVPEEVRVRLQRACGSWSNALFQLGLRETPEGFRRR